MQHIVRIVLFEPASVVRVAMSLFGFHGYEYLTASRGVDSVSGWCSAVVWNMVDMILTAEDNVFCGSHNDAFQIESL